MNISQTIYTLLRAILEGRIAGCKCNEGYFSDTPNVTIPCPVCAKWRAMVKVVCRHEPPTKEMRESWPFGPNPIPSCPICGLNLSGHRCPDLTTSRRGGRLLLVAMMDDMGLWKECYNHIYHEIEMELFNKGLSQLEIKTQTVDLFVKVIADGSLLVPAVKRWLEGRVK